MTADAGLSGGWSEKPSSSGLAWQNCALLQGGRMPGQPAFPRGSRRGEKETHAARAGPGRDGCAAALGRPGTRIAPQRSLPGWRQICPARGPCCGQAGWSVRAGEAHGPAALRPFPPPRRTGIAGQAARPAFDPHWPVETRNDRL